MTFGRLQSLYEESQRENASLQAENKSLRQELEWAKRQVKALKQKIFGAKSERFDPDQMQLLLNGLKEIELKAKKLEAAEREAQKAPARRRPSGMPRRVIPDHVEVEEIVLEPALEQLVCEEHGQKVKIDEARTQELDIIPPKFIKRIYIRPVYGCKPCEGKIVCAPAPERAAGKGWAAAGLLVWIVLSKYVDHLPLYRLEQIFRSRYDVRISRKTMSDWVQTVAFWLKPIYNHIHNELLELSHLHADETPVKFIDPDRKGKARQGYLWVLTAPGKDVLFHFDTRRNADVLAGLLRKNWQGVLHCDKFAAYSSLAKRRHGLLLAHCWAHARREFFEAREEKPWFVDVVLRHIAALYRVERYCRQRRFSPKLRLVYRQAQSRMILLRLKRILEWYLPKTTPSDGLRTAIRYILDNWEELTRFLDDGNIEIDNNVSENAIRPTAVGKKNWLFIGHPGAGSKSAIIYSIVESCKRHGIDPFEYLRDVLERLPKQTNHDISAFTPRAWAQQRKRAQTVTGPKECGPENQRETRALVR